MLNQCEGLLGPDVAHFCSCEDRVCMKRPHMFLEKMLNTSTVELMKTSFTTCVMFSKHKLSCVPEHLRYEMYRTQTQQDKIERNILHEWMDMVVLDCVPFLYYLQYLVNRKNGSLPRRLLAMFRLMDYINQKVLIEVKNGGIHMVSTCKGHLDTALHVLAHCWEMENRPDVSWQLYTLSTHVLNTNNIAWVHLIRLFRKTLSRRIMN